MAGVGGWGPTHDKRSRIVRRTKKRERVLGLEWDVSKPGVADLVARLAKVEMMAERTYDTLDTDPKSTRRIWAGLIRGATGIRAELTRLGARREMHGLRSGAELAEMMGQRATTRRGEA